MGKGRIREPAFLVISLVDDEILTPLYQASITVWSRQYARTATATLKTVRNVLSLCLKAFLISSFNKNIVI